MEQIATDRISLNVNHFKYWEALMTRVAGQLKSPDPAQVKTLDQLASIIERAQKGQRLAKGLSLDGQTEEQVRAEAQAETRTLIDIFIDSIKAHVPDAGVHDRIGCRLPGTGRSTATSSPSCSPARSIRARSSTTTRTPVSPRERP